MGQTASKDWCPAAEKAAQLGYQVATVRKHGLRLGGKKILGRWLFPRETIEDARAHRPALDRPALTNQKIAARQDEFADLRKQSDNQLIALRNEIAQLRNRVAELERGQTLKQAA